MLKNEVEEEKRDKLIGTVVQQGGCKFCGQLMKIETLIGWDEDKCNELATETCNCHEATEYTRRKGQKERAHSKIESLFETCNGKGLSTESAKVLHMAADLLSDGEAQSISLDAGNGLKAKISITSKGNIKVERTDSRKQAVEA